METQFTVRLYATGDLATQLAIFQDKWSEQLGQQAPTPKCPLIEIFRGQATASSAYVRHLDNAISALPWANEPVVEVTTLSRCSDHCYLQLSSQWVDNMLTVFSERMWSAEQIKIVPRQPLHLILAKSFDSSQHEPLQSLLDALDWSAHAGWDTQLQQQIDGEWIRQGAWPIQQP